MDYAILLQAEQHCSLSHTLALWRLMALERAKIKSRNKQDRFEMVLFTLAFLIFCVIAVIFCGTLALWN